MTVVIAKAHIQVFVGGVETDILPGVSFDASDAQIAVLLPIGAIYPVGSTGPTAVGTPTASPLIVGHGPPAPATGTAGQTYINVDGDSIYENFAGAWALLGFLSGNSGSSSGSGAGEAGGANQSASAPGGGAGNIADFSDPNNAYLVAAWAA